MAYRCTHLNGEVAGHNRFGGDGGLKALVLERAAIAPVVVDTCNGVLEMLQGEQVAGMMAIIVEVDAHTMVEQAGLEAQVPLAGLFPRDTLVADIVELGSRGAPQVFAHAKRGAGCIVAYIIVTAEVPSGTQQQVVDDAVLGEPRLVADHPAQLQAGEDAPTHTAQLQTVGLFAETAAAFHSQCELCEVAVAVVVVGIGIPGQVAPLVIGTSSLDIVHAGRDVWRLVVACRGILSLRLVVVVGKRGKAQTTVGIQVMRTELLGKLQTGIAHHADLLGEHRLGHILYTTDTLDEE